MKITASVQEACVMTGLGKTKLYELIAQGKVKTVTVGRRRLVHIESIYVLLETA